MFEDNGDGGSSQDTISELSTSQSSLWLMAKLAAISLLPPHTFSQLFCLCSEQPPSNRTYITVITHILWDVITCPCPWNLLLTQQYLWDVISCPVLDTPSFITLQICPWNRLSLITDYLIEAKTKWPTISRRHFRMHFLEWKCVNFH